MASFLHVLFPLSLSLIAVGIILTRRLRVGVILSLCFILVAFLWQVVIVLRSH